MVFIQNWTKYIELGSAIPKTEQKYAKPGSAILKTEQKYAVLGITLPSLEFTVILKYLKCTDFNET